MVWILRLPCPCGLVWTICSSNYLVCGYDSLSSDSIPMATSNLSHQTARPFPTACVSSRPPSAAVNLRRHLPPPPKPRKLTLKTNNRSKWAIQLSLVEQSPPKSTFNMQQLVGFLYDDLTHLFDDQGIDQTAYDERVFFRDPITKHDTLSGYLFNIALLKNLFRPQFQLHWVKPVRFKTNFFFFLCILKYVPVLLL